MCLRVVCQIWRCVATGFWKSKAYLCSSPALEHHLYSVTVPVLLRRTKNSEFGADRGDAGDRGQQEIPQLDGLLVGRRLLEEPLELPPGQELPGDDPHLDVRERVPDQGAELPPDVAPRSHSLADAMQGVDAVFPRGAVPARRLGRRILIIEFG